MNAPVHKHTHARALARAPATPSIMYSRSQDISRLSAGEQSAYLEAADVMSRSRWGIRHLYHRSPDNGQLHDQRLLQPVVAHRVPEPVTAQYGPVYADEEADHGSDLMVRGTDRADKLSPAAVEARTALVKRSVFTKRSTRVVNEESRLDDNVIMGHGDTPIDDVIATPVAVAVNDNKATDEISAATIGEPPALPTTPAPDNHFTSYSPDTVSDPGTPVGLFTPLDNSMPEKNVPLSTVNTAIQSTNYTANTPIQAPTYAANTHIQSPTYTAYTPTDPRRSRAVDEAPQVGVRAADDDAVPSSTLAKLTAALTQLTTDYVEPPARNNRQTANKDGGVDNNDSATLDVGSLSDGNTVTPTSAAHPVHPGTGDSQGGGVYCSGLAMSPPRVVVSDFTGLDFTDTDFNDTRDDLDDPFATASLTRKCGRRKPPSAVAFSSRHADDLDSPRFPDNRLSPQGSFDLPASSSSNTATCTLCASASTSPSNSTYGVTCQHGLPAPGSSRTLDNRQCLVRTGSTSSYGSVCSYGSVSSSRSAFSDCSAFSFDDDFDQPFVPTDTKVSACACACMCVCISSCVCVCGREGVCVCGRDEECVCCRDDICKCMSEDVWPRAIVL